MLGSRVRVLVLCPGWIRTNIATSDRNWLERLGSVPSADESEKTQIFRAMIQSLVEGGMEPTEVAGHVLDAVRKDRFWILPNAESITPAIKEIAASAVEGRTPPTVQPA